MTDERAGKSLKILLLLLLPSLLLAARCLNAATTGVETPARLNAGREPAPAAAPPQPPPADPRTAQSTTTTTTTIATTTKATTTTTVTTVTPAASSRSTTISTTPSRSTTAASRSTATATATATTTTTTTSRATASSGAAATPDSKCQKLASCAGRRRRSSRQSRLHEAQQPPAPEDAESKRPCHCDRKCLLYGDCCRDAGWLLKGSPVSGAELRQRRARWFCQRINGAYGSVKLRASCPPEWAASGADPGGQVAARCSYVRSLQAPTAGPALDASGEERARLAHLEYLADPVGMMLPITDTSTGVTYANSHCLRCHKLGAKPRLVYWQPLLECSYNLDTDDRNSLYDLVSAGKGQALSFSRQLGHWAIRVPGEPGELAAAAAARPVNASERWCRVAPTAPESVEASLRFCAPPPAPLLQSCPERPPGEGASPEWALQALDECRLGRQAPVYTEWAQRGYLNAGCARCNGERGRLLCESQLRRRPAPPKPLFVNKHVEGPASGLGRAGGFVNSAVSGSFSLLMDLGGLAQGDTLVGSMHQCPDPERQIYDPFQLACRDLVCGFHAVYLDGAGCQELAAAGEQSRRLLASSLVDKFEPALAWLTLAGLLVSVAALLLYLLLHWLSMFDLRPLLVAMAAAASERPGSPLERQRGSKASAASTAARTESLSSRGVASLAGSLLLAYLLFLAGHQRLWQPDAGTCVGLAASTYCCFLVAFNWMFLLSYDIWRTLRLATCQLRAPAAHAQSWRFLSYSLLALGGALLLAAVAVWLDLAPPAYDTPLERLLTELRPRFGQRPGSCWFANRRALALLFGAPIGLILLLNLVFFLHSSCMVVRTSARSSRQPVSALSVTKSRRSSGADSLAAADEQPPMSLVAAPAGRAPAHAKRRPSASSQSQQCSLASSCDTQQTSIVVVAAAAAAAAAAADHCQPSAASTPEVLIGGSPEKPPSLDSTAAAAAAARPRAHPSRKLEPSQSSSSLGNQSLGAVSLAASLAQKYDAQMGQLGQLAHSLAKDYRLYCRLSTIMGLTWLTGLLASLVDQHWLWYLFVALNTLQGLFVFIAFGCKRSKLLNLEILCAYLRFRCCCCCCWPSSAALAAAPASGASSESSSAGSSMKRASGG